MEAMEAVRAWFALHPFVSFGTYQIAGLLGMVIHFLKLDVKGQTADDIKTYFKENVKNTIAATVITLFAAGTAFAMGQGLMAAFLAGYAFDSALNKGN